MKIICGQTIRYKCSDLCFSAWNELKVTHSYILIIYVHLYVYQDILYDTVPLPKIHSLYSNFSCLKGFPFVVRLGLDEPCEVCTDGSLTLRRLQTDTHNICSYSQITFANYFASHIFLILRTAFNEYSLVVKLKCAMIVYIWVYGIYGILSQLEEPCIISYRVIHFIYIPSSTLVFIKVRYLCVCVCEIYEFSPPLPFHSVHLLALRTDECSCSCGCACFRLQMAGASWSLCCGVISWFFICLNLAGNGELFQNAIHQWNRRCEARKAVMSSEKVCDLCFILR